MRKKCTLLFICCVYLLSNIIPFAAIAAQSRRIIQSYEVEGENIYIRCANIEENAEYSVTLDGNPLQIDQETVAESNVPVTVFCLVDTSGSIGAFKKSLIQDTLLEISASMNPDDSMVIAEVNNQIQIGDPLYLREDRDAAIRRITASNKDTNLYAGVVESIDQILSNENYNQYTCLVILSDGDDCQDNGFTENEVITAIQESRVPVFTVALVQNYSERENAKILGSFARSSYGGQHFTTVGEGGDKPLRQDVSGKDFGSQIWESLMSTRVLTAKIVDEGQYEHNSHADVTLTVQCKAEENLYDDSVSVSVDFNAVKTTEGTEEPTISETEPTEERAQIDPKPESDYTYYWIALIVIGILAALVVVIYVKSKKKKPTKELHQEENGLISPSSKPEKVPAPKSETPKAQLSPIYKVFITDIPHGTLKVNLTIQEGHPMSLGRDTRAGFILNSKDSKLSGKHFSLLVENGICNVKDEGSLNGTYLNGVSIKGKSWTKMRSADKVRAGSYEYRVTIESIQGEAAR